MKLFIIALFSTLTACSALSLVRDPAPASIDMGHKRVETEICGRQGVGENGCVFPDGNLDGILKIYKGVSGSVSIIGQGCSVDKNFHYEFDGNPWIELPLKELIGERIDNDCVLDIFQYLKFYGDEESPHPIRGMHGTVTLGTCPEGVVCNFDEEQVRAGWHPKKFSFDGVGEGDYLLRGCKQQIGNITHFTEPFTIDFESVWPGGYPLWGKQGCLFILGVKGENTYKIYRKVWIFKEETIKVDQPSLQIKPNGSKIKFKGDQYVSLSTTDTNRFSSNQGDFVPSIDGNTLRFFTIQGRSLVLFFKDDKIIWVK